MEKEGRAVRVCGLPLDITESRLSDKLQIHFLRRKNGGGDISSISVSKTPPGSALITFEDSEVAQRVVKRGIHTLQVGGKEYALTASLHKKEINPDELFVDSAVVVDYSKLPGGKAAISNMHKSFPDVTFTFHPHDNICTLKGGYSKVHALTNTLLGHLDSQKPKDFQLFNTTDSSDQKAHSDSEKMEGPWQTEFSEQACGLDLSKHVHIASERNLSPTQIISDDGSKDDETLDEGTSQDDFSMVIDSDIFGYIQKHCSKDYRSILDRHGVEVLDVSTNDITTLFLQLKAEAVGRGRGDMWSAHVELGWLYQEKEAQLRKEQLPKQALLLQGLQNALEVLKQTFPKLLINEDKANIYLVGSGSDVSEGKELLMDINGTTKEHSQAKKTLFQPSGAASLSFVPDVHVDAQFRKEGLKRGKKSHLAAKFEGGVSTEKSLSTLDDRKPFQDEHTDTYQSLSEKHLRENSSPKDRKLLGEDVLFKEPEPIPEHSHKPLATFAPSDSVKNAANGGEIQSHSLDTIDLSRHNGKEITTASSHQSESGHTLRQTNSFSGPVRPKQGRNEKISKEDLPLVTNEGSHLKHDHYPDSWVFSVEVKVPSFQWVYMKQFHFNEIEDITSDLKMTETQTRTDTTLLLRGADAANIGVSQERLKELIYKIAKEFTTNEMSLASLGVLDSKTETVEQQCRAAREKFERVQIILLLKSIFFLGPELECLEAMSALKEWFCDETQGRLNKPYETHYGLPSATSTHYGLPSATSTHYDLPSATSTHYGLPSATSTRYDLPSATSTHYDLPSATSTHYDLPSATSTHYDLPSATSTHYDLPSATSTHYDLPSATSTHYDLPSATSTHYDLPSATSTHYDLPSATSTHYDLPSATSTHYGLPSATSTHYGLPSATSTHYGLPSATSTHYGLPSATSTHYGLPSATSTHYGLPSATSTHYGLPSATSTHYGLPSATSTHYGLCFSSTSSPSVNEEEGGTVTALRDSHHLPSDQPQYLKYQQDGETDTKYSKKGGSLKNDANSSEGMHGCASQNMDRQIYGAEEQKTPNPSDLSERKSVRVPPIQQERSPPLFKENGDGSAPRSDNDTIQTFSVETSEKSLPSSVLSSKTHSPASISDPQNISHGEENAKSTHNQDTFFIQDNPAFLEEHRDVKLTSTTSGGMDVSPWCKGKVNRHCSICPKSETADPQSASNKHYEGKGFEDQPEDQIEVTSGLFCVCGITGQSVAMMACGVALCPTCQEKSHSICRVCHESEETVPGIRGTMMCTELSLSLPGHNKDTTLKISYTIPDGLQGATHLNPGAPFRGGCFDTYLPMNELTRRLLPPLQRAFHQGLAFTLRADNTHGARVVLGSIPLKTSIEGGISRNGYPDSGYLRRLTDSLKGI